MNSFKEWVSVGVSYLGAGIRDFTRWKRLMRLTFGPPVEPFSRDIWEWAAEASSLVILPTKKRQNCWEFWEYDLRKSLTESPTCRKCPAVVDMRLDGVHGGRNAGRACWVVPGTLCGGELHGEYQEKKKTCMSCDFFRSVRSHEEPFFIPAGALAAMIAGPDSQNRVTDL